VLLHGLALAGIVALARSEEAPPAMRWEVAMVMPAAEAPVAAPEPVSRPEPTPPAPMARPTMPTPPEPVAQVMPQPVTRAVAAPSQVAAPPVEAQAAVVAAPVAARLIEMAVPAPPRVVEAPTPKVAVVVPPSPPDDEARKRWYAGLRAKLAELKQYPLVARRQGQEGVVVLKAIVQPDGSVEVMLKLGSGFAALDRAAVKLFEDAASAMRTALVSEQPLRLEIPVAYRLDE
jgi:protein TonB